ncbi:MAG: glycosyltransferase family 4 protein [Ruminococcaceae bacterium]|nr:glycosyltransferase family 4 protein [Oscillospiraceae bacterium]
MKILMVNKFLYPRGGSESYMLSLGKYLEEKGHTVEYFGMYDKANTVRNSAELYTTNMDFHSKGLSRFFYPFKIIYSIEARRKITKVIDNFKPDIVHMNNINFQLTPSIIYGVKSRKIPLVQTVHDYQMLCPNHLFYNFEKNETCEKCVQGSYINCVKNNCIHGSKIKSIIGAIEAIFYSVLKPYKKVDMFICPSNFLSDKLTLAKKFYKGKTVTLHNFINKEQFKKEESSVKPYIAYVGRLSKEKGVELIRKTAELLPQYTFCIAGSGPDEEILKNVPNIKMMGFLKGDELCEFIASSEMLLLPSVCYENCPLSILEAQSLGVPVVTMNYGGMRELVEDGVTGSLVTDISPEGIKEKILELTENEEYYKSIKENVKQKRDTISGIDTYCEKLISLYEGLVLSGNIRR